MVRSLILTQSLFTLLFMVSATHIRKSHIHLRGLEPLPSPPLDLPIPSPSSVPSISASPPADPSSVPFASDAVPSVSASSAPASVSASSTSSSLPSVSAYSHRPPPHHDDPFSVDAGFDIRAVVETSRKLPSHSWEFGTESEALLELYNPELSVYGEKPFANRTFEFNPEDVQGLVYAKEKIIIGTAPNVLSDGDGAVGDPASLGVFAHLLGRTDPKYAEAAKAQVEYVYSGAPRWPNGAISHRADHAALWADFIYMAPPFMAYWGVVENNPAYLQEAVSQCALYRDVLRMKVSSNATGVPPQDHHAIAIGLWEHIIDTTWADHGLWSTSNGWAAAGMMRVLATVIKAPRHITQGFKHSAITQLSGIIREILDGAIRIPRADNRLLRNYLDDPTWFGEVSGSTLLASVAYRMSTLREDIGLSYVEAAKYAAFAEDIRHTLAHGDHISANGTATPAVNPLDWNDRREFTSGSPEGNSFVVLLYAAYRDCQKARAPGCWF